jgi:putative SOS response-associated peptidase YedK
MCGIATNTKPKKLIEDRFNASSASLLHQPIIIAKAFANDCLPIITQQEKNLIQLAEWGLVPTWAKEVNEIKKIRTGTINARAETVFEKPSFKNVIHIQRCLVLCDGFIEYQHVGNQKQAYYVQLKSEQLFAIAGIYTNWLDTKNNTTKTTFSMLTVPANELMSIIHNSKKRMPLILPLQQEKDWLGSLSDTAITTFFKPFPTEHMKAHPIDNIIGKKNISKTDLFLLTKKEIISQGSLF